MVARRRRAGKKWDGEKGRGHFGGIRVAADEFMWEGNGESNRGGGREGGKRVNAWLYEETIALLWWIAHRRVNTTETKKKRGGGGRRVGGNNLELK